jgi:DNA polymerase-3 subunit epsilon
MELSVFLIFGAAACLACAAYLARAFLARSERPDTALPDQHILSAPVAPPIGELKAASEPTPPQPKSPEPPFDGWRPIRTVRPSTPVDSATAIPKRIVFLDVETTGLTEKDRVVTLAGVKLLDTDLLVTGKIHTEYLHLVFDPGRKSHPRAEAVHGYSDWVLRHQDSFDAYAEAIENFFSSADLVVAHNAEFDLGFYNREMDRAARRPVGIPDFCTMNTYRQRGFAGSCSLNAVCRNLGIARNGKLHGALEDAWLAMRVYLWLHERNLSADMPIEFTRAPTNFKPTPPVPLGPLPRRRRRKAAVVVLPPAPPPPSIN